VTSFGTSSTPTCCSRVSTDPHLLHRGLRDAGFEELVIEGVLLTSDAVLARYAGSIEVV